MVYFAKIYHNKFGDDKPLPKEKKKPKPIPKESKKRKVANNEYKALRKVYLENHPLCEVKLKGCSKKATEIHHDQGRGIKLNDVANFVAICRNCHNIVENQNLTIKTK